MDSEHVDEQLFAVDVSPLEAVDRPISGGLNKTFRHYDQHQQFLIPPSIDEWLPEEHLARFVSDLVEEALDLEPFFASYTEAKGFPPYDPRMMLKLIIYGYSTGVRSSRAIEKACWEDVAFRWLSANQTPDFRSIARFRRRHLVALRELFRTSLVLCERAGMVRLGRVALDGTKVRANASRRKAMSYRHLSDKEKVLAAQVDDLLHDAEVTDAREDKALGKDRGYADLPDGLATKEKRLAAIRKAKADLEARAADDAAAKARTKAREQGLCDEEIERRADEAASSATVKDSAQANFTDPDARIMKTADGSFHYCYNAQAIVDDAHQVIVATVLTNKATDVRALPEMLDEVLANTKSTPRVLLADAGYFSEDNVTAATSRRIDPLIATGRLRHGEVVPGAPRGRIPRNLSPREPMARKLRTKRGKAAYARRKAIVEPVFGQIGTCHGGKRVLLRGHTAAAAEWELIAAVHNLRKLFGHAGTAILIPS